MIWKLTAEALRQQGFWRAGLWHGMPLVMAHLQRSMAYTGHVIPQGDRRPRALSEVLDDSHRHMCHAMETAITAPALFDFITVFHGLAAEYFQEEPMLYSVNAFWKKPGAPSGWHYDEDDRKQLVMFIYGTDVLNNDQGIHQYVRGSHTWSREQLKWIHNVEEKVPPAEWTVDTFIGPAGTFFFTDTRGLHNGFPPKEEARLLLWARWGVSDPPVTYRNDELSPVHYSKIGLACKPSEEVQRRTRLVVDWSDVCQSSA